MKIDTTQYGPQPPAQPPVKTFHVDATGHVPPPAVVAKPPPNGKPKASAPPRAKSEILDAKPPANEDAEIALIGCLLIEPGYLEKIGPLHHSQFHNRQCGRLFEHVGNMPVNVAKDSVLRLGWLQRTRDLEACGGVGFIGQCLSAVPYAHHAPHYASCVREEADRRRARRLGERLILASGDPTVSPEQLVEMSGQLERSFNTQALFNGVTAAEMQSMNFEVDWLVDDLLVAGQPGILAGPKKSLKTTLLLALCLSLSTGERFLGKFSVPRKRRVLLLSGESGGAVIRETLIRIAAAMEISLSTVDNLIIETERVPRFGSPSDVIALGQFIKTHRAEVLCIDPTYMAMPAADASNMMAQGEVLGIANQLCVDHGCTLLLAHHTKRQLTSVTPTNRFPMPELEDIAWAGYQEFARQWILVARRDRYQAGSGVHNLWFSTGGSQGHGGEWGLDVYEGDREYAKEHGRIWEATLIPIAEARNAANERKDKIQEAKDAKRLEINRARICNAIAGYPDGETKETIKGACGIRQQEFLLAWGTLQREKSILETDNEKTKNKPYYAWILSDKE